MEVGGDGDHGECDGGVWPPTPARTRCNVDVAVMDADWNRQVRAALS
jgi:hypothetical protein